MKSSLVASLVAVAAGALLAVVGVAAAQSAANPDKGLQTSSQDSQTSGGDAGPDVSDYGSR